MKKNTNIFERIMQLANSKGIKNVPELAVYMGYSAPEKLYRLERDPDANPSYNIIADFTNKFEDLNVRWLITGIGEPLINRNLVNTPDVKVGANSQKEGYIAQTPIRKSRGIGAIPAESDPPTDPPKTFLTPQIVTVDKSGYENILYINAKAAAGYLQGYGDKEYIETLPSFSLPGLTNASYRSFQVDGDSMFPTLENKEMVIGQWVEQLDYIREDRVHIVVTKNHGIIIKRLLNRIEKYGYIIAKSDAIDNRNIYPNIEIYPDEILEVWYAVWHGSFNFKSPAEMYKKVNNLEADLTEVLRVLKEKNLM